MKIRTARTADAAGIVELVTRVLRDEYPQDVAAYSTEDLDRLSETYLRPTCTFLIAQDEQRIIGTCGVKADGSETAILRRLVVDPQHRTQGIGTELLKAALSFCKGQGFQEVVIRTSVRMKQAIRLCHSMGFEEDGRWSIGEVTLVRYRLRLT